MEARQNQMGEKINISDKFVFLQFQAFNWESWRRQWYQELASKAADLSKCGVTAVWLPPPTESVAAQGLTCFLLSREHNNISALFVTSRKLWLPLHCYWSVSCVLFGSCNLLLVVCCLSQQNFICSD